MPTRTNRIWDFLVLWPFIYVVLAMVIGFSFAGLAANMEDPSSLGPWLALFPLVIIVHFATIISMMVTYVYAIHRLYVQTNLTNEQKKTWLILVIIFNVFAIPFLHFTHLRK